MKSDDPLSIPKSDRALRSSAAMKRLARLAWIVVVNALVVWEMFVRLRSVGFPATLDFQLCFEFVFELFLPTVGIVFEILNWRVARWVNVGSFVIAGCYWLVAAVWDHSDPFFGVLLIIGIGLFVVAGLNELAYRVTKKKRSVRRQLPVSPNCVFDASLVPGTCPERLLDLKGLINKWLFTFTGAAYNLCRLRNLMARA